ncbi:MAG: hypothetical protein PHF46_04170 [Candidatus Gracilibacteria bacterium]|nr:hypothetical protein [Candidatus Gracilibacteria bacterium]
MKKIAVFIIFTFLVFAEQTRANASDFSTQSCSSFGVDATSCQQCFNGGTVYTGEALFGLYDDYTNNSGLNQIMFMDSWGSINFTTLQRPGTVWEHSGNGSENMFSFVSGFFDQTSKSGRSYHMFAPGSNERFIVSKSGYGIRLASVTSGDRNSPGYRVTYSVNYQNLISLGNMDPVVNTHNECVFFYPSWCGDGVKDSQEQCDPNDSSHAGWINGLCSANCTTTNIPTGSCGDGVKDSQEQCDPNDSSHAGWGSSGCSANCTPIGGGGSSCTPGPTNGTLSNPITGTTVGLCQPGVSVGNFISNTIGGVTTYTWSCGSYGGCQANYAPPSSSSSNGGSLSCTPGTVNPSVSCPITQTTAGLCQPGVLVGNFISNTIGGVTRYDWSCGGISGCYTSCSPTGGGPTNYCGDGIIQRPNSNGFYEECDPGSNNSWCFDCQISAIKSTPGSSNNLPGTLMITNPGVGNSYNLSKYKVIVGNGVNVFNQNDTLTFSPAGPMYLDARACIDSDNSLVKGSEKCTTDKIGWIQNGDKVLFSGDELTNFVGSTSNLLGEFVKDTNGGYIDNRTYCSQLDNCNFSLNVGYWKTPINVRVSKSVVSGTSGGGSYLAKPMGYSVDLVSLSFLDNLKNGNFMGMFANSNIGDFKDGQKLSSQTSNFINCDSSDCNIIDGSENLSKITTSHTLSGFGNTFVNLLKLDNNNLNKVIKSNSPIIINEITELEGVKTLVIENGDLTINTNITYKNKNASWAFVVKNGNINISNNVTRISGVFIVLNNNYGIKGTNTINQLYVDGSLYGDSSDLVNNRTYVRGQNSYQTLSTGVVVNYSNRSLINTPPLLSNFLKQFNVVRVAK